MSGTQFFPIPPELFARACETVSARVFRLPFLRSGIRVDGTMVGVAMECLNAVPTRSLAITARGETGSRTGDGLDRCIAERLQVPGTAAAPVIAEVLCSAGIAEPVPVADRTSHRQCRGIRLVDPWTWHIASVLAPSLRVGNEAGGRDMSWMDRCAVCRTGMLDRVTGKQLFGIPRTDYYVECSHCGAKFIPVGPAFRLVSVARIRDPLWKKHLEKTYPPETWAALARGPGSVPTPVPAPAKAGGAHLPPAALMLTPLKDGSLSLPVQGKTLFFRPVSLRFAGNLQKDTFSRVQKPLDELLADPAYEHLRSPVNQKYSRYLHLKTGLFLLQLRERHDPFYREFLNPFGDEKTGTFRAEETKDSVKRGIVIVVINRGLYHVIDASVPLQTLLNTRFGRVGPDDCLLTGDSLRCRINALLSGHKKEAGLWFHPLESDEERLSVIRAIEAGISAGPAGKNPGTGTIV